MRGRKATITSLVLALAALALTGDGEAQRSVAPGQPAPDIAGGPWINSPPLSLAELRGRVVVVEFWTFG
jgi:hypothetical protein